MQEEALAVILNKIEALRDNPHYSEIKNFLHEVKNLLQSVNSAIDDNVKKMPGAAKKIFKVTEATENATNEILDAVDNVLRKIDIATENYSKMHKIISNGKMEVLDLINTTIQFINEGVDKPEIIKYLNNFLQKYENDNLVFIEFEKIIEESREILSNIMNDSTQIMMSSQVQDITSQQLAAVNHTLENVQQRLMHVLMIIESVEMNGQLPESHFNEDKSNISHLHRDIAFDPDAVKALSVKESKQDEIDDLFSKFASGEAIEIDTNEEPVSVDDIDDLINSFTSFNKTEEETTDDGMSQDDINALFG